MLDERTKNYFNKIKSNLGYKGYNASWYSIKEILEKKGYLEESELKEIKTYNGYVNSSDITVYSYKINGELRYCAELSYQTDIDDYCTETHIFNEFPKEKDIHLIIDINSLEFKFMYKRLEPEYTCWECGRHLHWLDNEGNFENKKNRLEEKYCGC